MISIHELKRMVQGKIARRAKCERCGKRRVLVDNVCCSWCNPTHNGGRRP